MNGDQQHEQSPEDRDDAARRPDEADEEQLDEAIEETFPASDPISLELALDHARATARSSKASRTCVRKSGAMSSRWQGSRSSQPISSISA